MNPTSLPDFVAQLNAQREGLLAQVRQQRGGDIGRADAAANAREGTEGDWASADAQHDLAVALEERELAELNAIGAALQRVADGSYGTCSDCGADIPPARLHAAPTALRCIGCQSQVETAHGGVRTPSL
jgi:DnaK suppressor protein